MLFAIDVGNTHIVLGVYDQKTLIADWRVHTEKGTTADEFSVLVRHLFAAKGLTEQAIGSVIISSVVPPLKRVLDKYCRKYLGGPPVWVDASLDLGVPILYDNPSEVGADRIVNAVAAHEIYPDTALIVIDFGTATTFDCITAAGEYLGGAISPGIGIAAEALFTRASKLPRVELFEPPASVIGKDTVKSMQAGIILGYAGLVDGLVGRIEKEMKVPVTVIATGGLSPLMADVSKCIQHLEPDLTLDGLRIIHDKLRGAHV